MTKLHKQCQEITQEHIGLASINKFKPLKPISFMSDAFAYKKYKFLKQFSIKSSC